MGNATVTARLDTETKEKLELLARTTARSKSFLILRQNRRPGPATTIPFPFKINLYP